MTDTEQNSEIEYKNFKPRLGMEPTASRLLNSTIQSIAPDAKAKTVIADKGDHFVFSIVVGVKKAFYTSEAIFKKSEMSGGPRLWQIHKLHTLLVQVIKRFLKKDNTTDV